MKRYISLSLFSLFLLTITPSHADSIIAHTFIALDEARNNLVYIDEHNSAHNWSVEVPDGRDLQLIGHNRVLMTTTKGFCEYSLNNGGKVREVTLPFSGVETARRLGNGHTYIGGNGLKGLRGQVIVELDSLDKEVRTINFSSLTTLRLMRLSASHTFCVGSNEYIAEFDSSGKELMSTHLDDSKHTYKVLKLTDGTYLASTGYGASVIQVDADGKTLKTYGGTPGPSEYKYNFFADFQLLPNNHIVATNWAGHGYNDGASTIGLIEYDTSGAIVWDWMDHSLVSSLHGVIILDGLDTEQLHDERNGYLEPIESPVAIHYSIPHAKGVLPTLTAPDVHVTLSGQRLSHSGTKHTPACARQLLISSGTSHSVKTVSFSK